MYRIGSPCRPAAALIDTSSLRSAAELLTQQQRHREPNINAGRINIMRTTPRGQQHPTRTAATMEAIMPSSTGHRTTRTTKNLIAATTHVYHRRLAHFSARGGPNLTSKHPRHLSSSVVVAGALVVAVPSASVLREELLHCPFLLSLAARDGSSNSSRGASMASIVAWEIAVVASPYGRGRCSARKILGMPPMLLLNILYPSGRARSLDPCLKAAAPAWEPLSVVQEDG